MIKLSKLNEPPVLTQNKEQWLNEYLRCHNSGAANLPAQYRHTEIKEQIKKETFDKCAYCESKVTHICPGDVEHILPKSRFPSNVYDWNNLTLACQLCNNSKRDFYDSTNPLLNPYIDNPEDFLAALGPAIFPKAGTIRGRVTINQLNLNRSGLLERRNDKLNDILHLIEEYNQAQPDSKETLRNQLIKEYEQDKEFSFTTKSFLRNNGVI